MHVKEISATKTDQFQTSHSIESRTGGTSSLSTLRHASAKNEDSPSFQLASSRISRYNLGPALNQRDSFNCVSESFIAAVVPNF